MQGGPWAPGAARRPPHPPHRRSGAALSPPPRSERLDRRLGLSPHTAATPRLPTPARSPGAAVGRDALWRMSGLKAGGPGDRPLPKTSQRHRCDLGWRREGWSHGRVGSRAPPGSFLPQPEFWKLPGAGRSAHTHPAWTLAGGGVRPPPAHPPLLLAHPTPGGETVTSGCHRFNHLPPEL